MSFPSNHIYSTPNRQYYSVVPANSQSSEYALVGGRFRTDRLPQTDFMAAVNQERALGTPFYNNDKSLAEVLLPIWTAVGRMDCKTGQLGTCALISANLAIIPSHCIENIDIRELGVVFGYHRQLNGQIFPGYRYKVLCVGEHNPHLDYAIVQIEGSPGLHWGYLPIQSTTSPCDSAPALLHYPLCRPLQVSVHAIQQTSYEARRLTAYHDSDYGSSGGAHISPSGTFLAMHLGSERNPYNWNLERFALPIQEIINQCQNSILHGISFGKYDQKLLFSFYHPLFYLIPHAREFIDLEKFIKEKLNEKEFIYTLRDPEVTAGEITKAGIIIERDQNKHTSGWPGGGRLGGKGNTFNPKYLKLDDTIQIAEILATEYSFLNNPQPKDPRPPIERWSLDNKKSIFDSESARTLYNTLLHTGVKSINLYAAFDSQKHSWEIHFYPNYHEWKKV